MTKLLAAFKARNNAMPAHIVIYRDGVGDSQFDTVLKTELPQVKDALAFMGYLDDAVKVSIIICQKGHHTRLVYEEKVPGGKSVPINPCPGLVVDASGGANSIVNAVINEFYLNSHVAIQGTAKPCKYALIYDEIGFKVSELELLTYWTTYLYCRCNRSVSYATPAYYAHWATLRAKNLSTVHICANLLSTRDDD
jgi:eukaryotic translation initiation factor 2C